MYIESVSSRLVSCWEDVGQPGKVAARLKISRGNTAAGPQIFLHQEVQDAGPHGSMAGCFKMLQNKYIWEFYKTFYISFLLVRKSN